MAATLLAPRATHTCAEEREEQGTEEEERWGRNVGRIWRWPRADKGSTVCMYFFSQLHRWQMWTCFFFGKKRKELRMKRMRDRSGFFSSSSSFFALPPRSCSAGLHRQTRMGGCASATRKTPREPGGRAVSCTALPPAGDFPLLSNGHHLQ